MDGFTSMLSSIAIAAGIFSLLFLALVAALSRHKKAGSGAPQLIGRSAFVEKALEPEGAVLVGGELWRARTRAGESVRKGAMVRVVGARGHLLEVEGPR